MSGGPVPAWIERTAGNGTDAARPPVVLLHGIGGGKAQWTTQLDLLADKGWRAIAWDMPGYGESALPAADFGFAALAQSLVRLLDTLEIGRAIVVGHSMGGMVALEACALAPGRVAGLVLACTSAAFGKTDGAWQQQFIVERVAPLDAGLGMTEVAARQVPRMMTAAASTAVREQAIAIMSAVPEATYRAALASLSRFDRRDVLRLIAVPALVLAASDDAQAPPAVMEKMASRINGAEFAVLPDCGHLANLEQPVLFADAVLEFLERRFAGT
ncbi:MAG: alpha/beta fold hydrolase [Betaproteobacteria bacterium]